MNIYKNITLRESPDKAKESIMRMTDPYDNPVNPLNPDYKRIVEFYSNKFQYVKLKFNGSNLQHRKIELPPRVLPVADTELKKDWKPN